MFEDFLELAILRGGVGASSLSGHWISSHPQSRMRGHSFMLPVLSQMAFSGPDSFWRKKEYQTTAITSKTSPYSSFYTYLMTSIVYEGSVS